MAKLTPKHDRRKDGSKNIKGYVINIRKSDATTLGWDADTILNIKVEDNRLIIEKEIGIMNEKEMMVASKLYDYMGWDDDKLERILSDWKHDYLTNNESKDNEMYLTYYDGTTTVAIHVETLAIIEDDEELSNKFYCFEEE